MANPVFTMGVVAIGAAATLLLLILRRWMPLAIAAPLALLAVTASYAIDPETAPYGLTGPLDLFLIGGVGLDGDSAGLVSMLIFGPAMMVTRPSMLLGLLTGHGTNTIWTVTLDMFTWSLLQMLAVSAAMSLAPSWSARTAIGRRLATAPWPHGWAAAVSTLACAALFAAAAIWIPSRLPTQYAHQISAAAMLGIIVVARIYRPELISWGAWIVAIGIVAVPWMLFPGLGNIHTQNLYQAIFSAIAAALLLVGPRPDPRRYRIAWIANTLLVMLPGLGFACFWILAQMHHAPY